MKKVKQNKIRNFAIIAHIDHGKSTLADRLIELSGKNLDREKYQSRVLDTLELEQEKGITIKLQATRLQWKGHQLNLIDTPGHVDFSYEVSRSLAACESALLLIDASQGIQAQTLSNTRKAYKQGLKLIPVLNKIDLNNINIERRIEEITKMLDFKAEEIIKVSAKTGKNIEQLMDAIIEHTPPPAGDPNKDLQALIFDSFYDQHQGVIVTTRVFDGTINIENFQKDEDKKLHILQKKENFTPMEFGIFTPEMQKVKQLKAGEVGYIVTGFKDIKYFTVGDTISDNPNTKPLPGYQQPKPNVFATFFPTETDEHENLKTALDKLCLNDSALTYRTQKSTMLGAGFRCGFLGLLHMEIVQERLEREFDTSLIITAPNVEYKVKKITGETETIQSAQELPDVQEIDEIYEPWVRMDIMTPDEYMGPLMELCQYKRGSYVNTIYLNQNKEIVDKQYIVIKYDIPLGSLISNFFSRMKSLSNGYASMEYEFIDYLPVNLVKVSILVNKREIPALSFLETKEHARPKSVKILEVLKETIPRQQFKVPLQAAIGSKIIARKDISALRKDVTAKLYGGDYSRKKKLLEKQKEGKKRLKEVGKVSIPQEAFLAVLKT